MISASMDPFMSGAKEGNITALLFLHKGDGEARDSRIYAADKLVGVLSASDQAEEWRNEGRDKSCAQITSFNWGLNHQGPLKLCCA